MDVDIATEITIDRRRSEVAEFACDPDHATEWYTNITEVNWKSPKPHTVGSLVEFTAKFLGRRLVYTPLTSDGAHRPSGVRMTSAAASRTSATGGPGLSR